MNTFAFNNNNTGQNANNNSTNGNSSFGANAVGRSQSFPSVQQFEFFQAQQQQPGFVRPPIARASSLQQLSSQGIQNPNASYGVNQNFPSSGAQQMQPNFSSAANNQNFGSSDSQNGTAKICENVKCQTQKTPLWRKGWKLKEGRRVRLCNACGLHFRKGHYCTYCNEIYRDVYELETGDRPWISCEKCEKWVHKSCAMSAGHYNPSRSFICSSCNPELNEKQVQPMVMQQSQQPQQMPPQNQFMFQQQNNGNQMQHIPPPTITIQTPHQQNPHFSATPLKRTQNFMVMSKSNSSPSLLSSMSAAQQQHLVQQHQQQQKAAAMLQQQQQHQQQQQQQQRPLEFNPQMHQHQQHQLSPPPMNSQTTSAPSSPTASFPAMMDRPNLQQMSGNPGKKKLADISPNMSKSCSQLPVNTFNNLGAPVPIIKKQKSEGSIPPVPNAVPSPSEGDSNDAMWIDNYGSPQAMQQPQPQPAPQQMLPSISEIFNGVKFLPRFDDNQMNSQQSFKFYPQPPSLPNMFSSPSPLSTSNAPNSNSSNMFWQQHSHFPQQQRPQ